MNDLETQNVHEFRIRSSLQFLLLKGAIAWLVLAILAYIYDASLVALVQNGNEYNLGLFVLNGENLLSNTPLFHFFVNAFYGLLLLHITLSWIYEYSMIKPGEILTHRGILFSHEQVYEIADIKTIEVKQGMWGKLFNTGTVRLYAYSAQKYVSLRNIAEPHAVAARVRELHPVPLSIDAVSAQGGGR